MRLYIVRHTEAHPGDVDPERPLTTKGEEDAARIGRALARIGVEPASVVHSGYVRARGTAEPIAEALDGAPLEVAGHLEPHSEAGIWVERLRGIRSDLVLVGHNPHLGLLLSALVGAPGPVARMRKGDVVCLRRPDETGAWEIEWLLTRKVLRRL